MMKDLKLRIITSVILILILFLMTMNNYFLGYFLIISGVISIIEFFNISSLIFKKKKIIQLLNNIIFSTYIFVFCSLFIRFNILKIVTSLSFEFMFSLLWSVSRM